MRKLYPLSCIALVLLLTNCTKGHIYIPPSKGHETIAKIDLGRLIFFDKSLSNPKGQACASCHSQPTGFSDPDHGITSPGIIPGLFGSRNSPAIAYSMFIPALHYDDDDETYVGGLFWDGRVNSLEEQAQKPFFNILEMNLTDQKMFVSRVKEADFYPLYQKIYGNAGDSTTVLKNVADAIATFERSHELNLFTSKFDYYLRGEASLTAQELRGFQLFSDPDKGKCTNCHPAEPDANSGKIMFTDFTYDNIGVPKNTNNPFYTIPAAFNPDGANFIDYGLAKTTGDPSNNGQFKVPTLRNIALSAPYFHNGFFNTLEEVVHFYNARDVDNFPPAEITGNVNEEELGNLHLTPQEEKDIVAFMKTLTDGYK